MDEVAIVANFENLRFGAPPRVVAKRFDHMIHRIITCRTLTTLKKIDRSISLFRSATTGHVLSKVFEQLDGRIRVKGPVSSIARRL